MNDDILMLNKQIDELIKRRVYVQAQHDKLSRMLLKLEEESTTSSGRERAALGVEIDDQKTKLRVLESTLDEIEAETNELIQKLEACMETGAGGGKSAAPPGNIMALMISSMIKNQAMISLQARKQDIFEEWMLGFSEELREQWDHQLNHNTEMIDRLYLITIWLRSPMTWRLGVIVIIYVIASYMWLWYEVRQYLLQNLLITVFTTILAVAILVSMITIIYTDYNYQKKELLRRWTSLQQNSFSPKQDR